MLTPSRPGHGCTLFAVGRSATQAAKVFIALLDGLDISKCSVVAISGGKLAGPALAAGFLQRVECPVLAEAINQRLVDFLQ